MCPGSSDLHSQRIDDLIDDLRARHSVMVALSGGVDSAVVAALAFKALGPNSIAITVDSPLSPSGEIENAAMTARQIGIPHISLALDELRLPGFSGNPRDRCYLCKRLRFQRMIEGALKRRINTVADGTNSSDLDEFRPGLRAAEELGIYSPLREAGLSKEDTRGIAAALGLRAADRPSSPCLATRVPYGQPLTLDKLRRIDRAELSIRELTGARVLRVRDLGNVASIEAGTDQLGLFDASTMATIAHRLGKLGYESVTLEPDGYRAGRFDRIT